jgi:hypothetical protein
MLETGARDLEQLGIMCLHASGALILQVYSKRVSLLFDSVFKKACVNWPVLTGNNFAWLTGEDIACRLEFILANLRENCLFGKNGREVELLCVLSCWPANQLVRVKIIIQYNKSKQKITSLHSVLSTIK